MNFKVVLANKNNSNIIKNIYPLYLHDIAEIYQTLPNEYGIFEEESIKTLMAQYDVQNIWFEKEGILFPFIIYADERPAGFALVGSKQYVPKDCDYNMYDYFILRPYRGTGIAEIAAKEIFSKFSGKWIVYTNPTDLNQKGQSFWNKTINNYTSGNFEKSLGATYDGEKLIFRFNNKAD